MVTDIFLGGETGFELVNMIREMTDNIPIVIMSAYADVLSENLIAGFRETFECHFVKKPFDNDDMEKLIRKLV